MGSIGERFKHLRKELHITQVALGQLIGVSGSAISQIEAGASKPTEAALKLICSTYHVNYKWLVDGEGDMLEEETPEDMIERLMAGESPLAISIMKTFASLPIEEWRKLRQVIDEVKNMQDQ